MKTSRKQSSSLKSKNAAALAAHDWDSIDDETYDPDFVPENISVDSASNSDLDVELFNLDESF